MVSALQQLIGQLIEFSLPGWIIGPPFQQVLPWSCAGRGEVIAGSLDQQRLVSAALLQHLQEPRALVQLASKRTSRFLAFLELPSISCRVTSVDELTLAVIPGFWILDR